MRIGSELTATVANIAAPEEFDFGEEEPVNAGVGDGSRAEVEPSAIGVADFEPLALNTRAGIFTGGPTCGSIGEVLVVGSLISTDPFAAVLDSFVMSAPNLTTTRPLGVFTSSPFDASAATLLGLGVGSAFNEGNSSVGDEVDNVEGVPEAAGKLGAAKGRVGKLGAASGNVDAGTGRLGTAAGSDSALGNCSVGACIEPAIGDDLELLPSAALGNKDADEVFDATVPAVVLMVVGGKFELTNRIPTDRIAGTLESSETGTDLSLSSAWVHCELSTEITVMQANIAKALRFASL
jgi:hypothetical protein